eukprot:837849-Pyramimonas_sp.AAC.1
MKTARQNSSFIAARFHMCALRLAGTHAGSSFWQQRPTDPLKADFTWYVPMASFDVISNA